MLTKINPYQVMLDIGPVQMSITAEKNGCPLKREWRNLEELVVKHLEDLKRYLIDAKKPWPQVENKTDFPKILEKMVSSVRSTENETLTPMAAVAGSMAELVSEYLAKRGATKVLVNNGGDIAIYLDNEETTKVGIVPKLGFKPTHYLEVKSSSGIGGIATSGRGGRSFTLGIADAAVAIASTASIADACATLLGNEVNVQSGLIERRLGRDLDPETDIPDQLVTARIGILPEEQIQEALENGYHMAKVLVKKKIIKGAVLFLNGLIKQYPEDIVKKIE